MNRSIGLLKQFLWIKNYLEERNKMKRTKRFFSIVMAALMVLCMTATALATEPVAPTPIGIGTDTPGAAQNV